MTCGGAGRALRFVGVGSGRRPSWCVRSGSGSVDGRPWQVPVSGRQAAVRVASPWLRNAVGRLEPVRVAACRQRVLVSAVPGHVEPRLPSRALPTADPASALGQSTPRASRSTRPDSMFQSSRIWASAPRDGARHLRHAVTRAARTRSSRPNRDISSTANRHRQ